MKALIWNTLPEAAEYLTKKLKDDISVRSLVNLVAERHETGSLEPTIIWVRVPRDKTFATLVPNLTELPPETEAEKFLRERTQKALEAEFGPPPLGFSYGRTIWFNASPLYKNALLDLLVHGYVETGYFPNNPKAKPHEYVWLMPYETGLKITLDDCGIRGVDLETFADELVALHGIGNKPAHNSLPTTSATAILRKNPLGGDMLTRLIWNICDEMSAEGTEIKPLPVFNKLKELADSPKPPKPLIGDVAGGVKFEDGDGNQKELSLDACKKRIAWWRKAPAGG